MDFEFISWISKSFWNDLSALCSCLQFAITSSFQLQFAHCLKFWTPKFPRFKMIYSMYKIEFGKYSKFFLKFRVHVTTRFWVLNYHTAWWILLQASFPMFYCLLSYSIMVISHLPNSWYHYLFFPYGPWVLTYFLI